MNFSWYHATCADLMPQMFGDVNIMCESLHIFSVTSHIDTIGTLQPVAQSIYQNLIFSVALHGLYAMKLNNSFQGDVILMICKIDVHVFSLLVMIVSVIHTSVYLKILAGIMQENNSTPWANLREVKTVDVNKIHVLSIILIRILEDSLS